MKNAFAISGLARQIVKVGEKLESLAMAGQETSSDYPDLAEVYQGLLLDEVEHAQILTLELTRLTTESTSDDGSSNADGDGSVFGPGELTAEKTGETGDGSDNGQPEEDN